MSVLYKCLTREWTGRFYNNRPFSVGSIFYNNVREKLLTTACEVLLPGTYCPKSLF